MYRKKITQTARTPATKNVRNIRASVRVVRACLVVVAYVACVVYSIRECVFTVGCWLVYIWNGVNSILNPNATEKHAHTLAIVWCNFYDCCSRRCVDLCKRVCILQ